MTNRWIVTITSPGNWGPFSVRQQVIDIMADDLLTGVAKALQETSIPYDEIVGIEVKREWQTPFLERPE